MEPSYSLKRVDQEQVTIFKVEGEIDIYSAPEFKYSMLEAIEGHRNELIIDLTGVNFIDSTGLGVLVSASRQIINRKGKLLLVADDQIILNIFEITGINKIISIYPTIKEAKDSF